MAWVGFEADGPRVIEVAHDTDGVLVMYEHDLCWSLREPSPPEPLKKMLGNHWWLRIPDPPAPPTERKEKGDG